MLLRRFRSQFAVLLFCGAASAVFGQDQSDPPGGAGPYAWTKVLEANVPEYKLPELLSESGGAAELSGEQWLAQRRPEILRLFEANMYGRLPEGPVDVTCEELAQDESALGGAATYHEYRVTCRAEGRELSFPFKLVVPNDAAAPAPVFLLIDFRPRTPESVAAGGDDSFPVQELIAAGYAAAVFVKDDICPDRKESIPTSPLAGLFPVDEPLAPDCWGALAAWGWGASRILDCLEENDSVDAERVAIVGHSRCGKAALWAGACDQRFALAVSNNSGCGGAALSRRRVGETIAKITENFPYWFCPTFQEYAGREGSLPLDQHMLIALMAPRMVYVASAEEDHWADPHGEFLALANASPAFRLFGDTGINADQAPRLDEPLYSLSADSGPARTGRMGYHIRPGSHRLTLSDWRRYIQFADRAWKESESDADAAAGVVGFTPLFHADGPPEGWVVTRWDNLSKPADEGVQWRVVDGVLHGSEPRGTWLVSEEQYGDFELRFEFKLGERGNSGLALRAPMHGDPAFDAMELQMADLRYNTAAKDSELTGGIYRAIAPEKQVFKPTEWNSYEVKLTGDHLFVKLNGHVIHDRDLSEYSEPVERHDGGLAPPVKDRPRRGHIGFQELSRGGDHVQIRSARIRVLDSEG